MTPSIVFLMPYFGRWPRWWDLYLETCRWNPTVDWVFLTDCPIPHSPPPNVRFFPMTLPEFAERAEERLGMPVELEYPFKICDLRPAFGVVLDEYVKGYDFWGWGDVDVFYGDIRRAIPETVLQVHDVISPRDGFLAGEFTLFRNSDRARNLFRDSRDHETVFASGRSWNFSEYGFFKDRVVDSITHVARRAHSAGSMRLWTRDVLRTDRKLKGRPFRFYWREGRLYDLRTGEDVLLYHFLDRKRDDAFRIASEIDPERGFLVTHDGVEACPAPLKPSRRPITIYGDRLLGAAKRVRRFLLHRGGTRG